MVEMLKHHASLGDVQTSASVLLALGDRRRSLTTLDEATQEHWLLGYLDILARYRLWEVGTQVSILCTNFVMLFLHCVWSQLSFSQSTFRLC
jgi:hypothetical protein